MKKTKKYGRGVYATQTISRGELIAVFDGPIMDNNFSPWTKDLQNHSIQVGRTKWRDSKGLARFINHSCEPNCGIKRRNRVVAMRTIKRGEEITWDYEMTERSRWWKLKCRCGSAICRKTIGNFTNMPKHIRKKYSGFISTWLTSN